MTITVNTKVYGADRYTPDSITYTGPANSMSNIDVMELKRVYPKKGTGVVKGVARPTFRVARDVVVDTVTGQKQTAYFNGALSLPVGMSDADIVALIADIVDWYSFEETGSTNHAKKLDITY